MKTFYCPHPLSKTAASRHLVFDLDLVFIPRENADRKWMLYVTVSFQAGWKGLVKVVSKA